MSLVENNEIKILHLSDLHFGFEETRKYSQSAKEKRKETLLALKNDLSKVNDNWKPDIIVVSGDLGWNGKKENYQEAFIFLQDLLESLGIGSDRLVICPGNHDRDISYRNSELPSAIAEEADIKLEKENLSVLEENFNGYISFCQDLGISPLRLGDEQNYLVGYVDILGIRFVVINSAWFCSGKPDDWDRAKLFVGNPFVRKMKIANQLPDPSSLNMAPITMMVIHHPPEWLHHNERAIYENRPASYEQLATRCHVVLSGHSHGERLLKPHKLFMTSLLFISGATYDKPSYQNNCSLFKIKIQHNNKRQIIQKRITALLKT